MDSSDRSKDSLMGDEEKKKCCDCSKELFKFLHYCMFGAMSAIGFYDPFKFVETGDGPERYFGEYADKYLNASGWLLRLGSVFYLVGIITMVF